MDRRIVVGLSASIALVVSALWLWQNAVVLTWNSGDPERSAWAARMAALAIAAGAQWAISRLVLVPLYGREKVSDAYALGAAMAFVTSLTGVLVLVSAGR